MYHGCFIATRNNETTAETPCTILNSLRGYLHRIRTRSSFMRMSSEWFEAARRYTDSPSLGRCVHHVRGTLIKKALRKQVHQPQFIPKDWEFEVLTKLMVLGQQPAQAQEPRTHEITFFENSAHSIPPADITVQVSQNQRVRGPTPSNVRVRRQQRKTIPGKGSRHRHP